MENLNLRNPRRKRHKTTCLPTWGQIKALTSTATRLVIQSGNPVTPMTLFVACLSLLTVTSEATKYWAYMTGPPVVQPVTWEDSTPRVYTNFSFMGNDGSDFLPPVSIPINWTGTSFHPPICIHRESRTNKIMLSCLGAHFVGRILSYKQWYQEQNAWKTRLVPAYWQKLEVIGPPSNVLPPPKNMGLCPKEGEAREGDLIFSSCYVNKPKTFQIPGTSLSIGDLSREEDHGHAGHLAPPEFPYIVTSRIGFQHGRVDSHRLSVLPEELQEHNKVIPQSELITSTGRTHSDLWKLYAALDKVYTNDSIGFPENFLTPLLQIQACVPPPFYLVVGDGTVTRDDTPTGPVFRIYCPDCTLTNCLPIPQKLGLDAKVFVVQQPPYWMIPVEVNGPWYANYGMQLAQELLKRLHRTRRFLGLLIAGIIATITIIATAATAVVALHESAQTADHVNELAKNITIALDAQKRIDEKLEAQIEALKEAVLYLGDQFVVLKTVTQLICHDAYKHICVTPLEFNGSWDRVRLHLQGVWNHANISLDLLQLQQEIDAISHSMLHYDDPGDLANQILDQLNGLNPFNLLRHSFWYILGLFLLCLVILFLLCCLWRSLSTQLVTSQARIHFLQLRNIGGNVGSGLPVPG